MIVIPPQPAPLSVDAALAVALTRFLATGKAPTYLRTAGRTWLAKQSKT